MGIVSVLPRILLIIINLLFFLVSLALIVLGLLLRFGGSTITSFLNDALGVANTSVKALFSSSPGLNNSNLNLGDLFETVAIMAIVLGVIFLAFCFFGLFGACYKNECMLKTYVIVVSLLVIGQIVVILIFLINPDVLNDALYGQLKPTLDKYKGLSGTDAYSIVWTLLMIKLKCCGLKGHQDFKGSTSWVDVNKYATPLACCDPMPINAAEASACAGATSGTPVTSLVRTNYDNGCIEKIMTEFTLYFLTIVVVGLVAQVLLIISGIIMIVKKDKKNKVSPESDRTPRNRPRRRDSDW